jgi:hypothetical protein
MMVDWQLPRRPGPSEKLLAPAFADAFGALKARFAKDALALRHRPMRRNGVSCLPSPYDTISLGRPRLLRFSVARR